MPASSHARISSPLIVARDRRQASRFSASNAALRLVGSCSCKMRAWLRSADVGHLMRDDQMMLGVDRPLAHYSRPSQSRATGRHRAGSGSVKRDLLIGRRIITFSIALRRFTSSSQLDQLLLEPRGPGHKLLRRRLTRSCLTIGCCQVGSDSAQRSPRSAPGAAPSFPS